jgi:glutathione S-transferase
MKLLSSPPSPFARKVRVLALEKGLGERLEVIEAHPWPEPTAIIEFNPLGKVPTLILDDGSCLYDSPVICEYLDSLDPRSPLIPDRGAVRWRVLRLQALADGILDAAVNLVLEQRRPEAHRSSAMQKRFTLAIQRSFERLPGELAVADERFDLGQIAAACAVGYVEFRLPDCNFGTDEPRIRGWWTRIQLRPSLLATRPVLV